MSKRNKQLERQRERARKAYQRDKDGGVCAQTGCSRPTLAGHVYCAKCLPIKNAWTKEAKRKARKAVAA